MFASGITLTEIPVSSAVKLEIHPSATKTPARMKASVEVLNSSFSGLRLLEKVIMMMKIISAVVCATVVAIIGFGMVLSPYLTNTYELPRKEVAPRG